MSNPILHENESKNETDITNTNHNTNHNLICLFCNENLNMSVTQHTCLISNQYKSIVIYSDN